MEVMCDLNKQKYIHSFHQYLLSPTPVPSTVLESWEFTNEKNVSALKKFTFQWDRAGAGWGRRSKLQGGDHLGGDSYVNKDTEGDPRGYGNKLHFWFYFRLLGRGFLKSMLRRILRLSWCLSGRVPGLINDVCNECGRGKLDHVRQISAIPKEVPCELIIPVSLQSVLFQSPKNIMKLNQQVILSSAFMCT